MNTPSALFELAARSLNISAGQLVKIRLINYGQVHKIVEHDFILI